MLRVNLILIWFLLVLGVGAEEIHEPEAAVFEIEGRGQDHRIVGSGNIISIRGEAASVFVAGAGNVVTLEKADSLTVEGVSNVVTARRTSRIYLLGSLNRVDYGPFSRVIEAGMDNYATPLVEKETVAGLRVVELFTSQGCWSCPPADDYHTRLSERNDLLTLSYHVDYWDGVAWKDPLATPELTTHQKEYRRAFGSPTVYTPQMILNGRHALVGSNTVLGDHLLSQVDPLPELVRLECDPEEGGFRVSWSLPNFPAGFALKLLLVQDRALVRPTGGENVDKDLVHVHVVRAIRWLKGRPSGSTFLAVPPTLRGSGLSVALLVQDPDTMLVASGAYQALPTPPGRSNRFSEGVSGREDNSTRCSL